MIVGPNWDKKIIRFSDPPSIWGPGGFQCQYLYLCSG
ncbi:hypothetical protein DFAR_3800031 [Desulfarculales bacterium]